MTVVITRPSPDAENFAVLCAEAGLTTLIAPVMTITPLADWDPPIRAGALAFTSANGVRAYAEHEINRTIAAFCVGPTTAAEAERLGFKTVHTANGDNTALAELIIERANDITGPVLHIAGAHRAGDLVSLLTGAGIDAVRSVAYCAQEVADLNEDLKALLRNGDTFDVTLFSPRSADLFLALVNKAGFKEKLKGGRAICLSEAVAKIARNEDFAQVITASERNKLAMLQTLRS